MCSKTSFVRRKATCRVATASPLRSACCDFYHSAPFFALDTVWHCKVLLLTKQLLKIGGPLVQKYCGCFRTLVKRIRSRLSRNWNAWATSMDMECSKMRDCMRTRPSGLPSPSLWPCLCPAAFSWAPAVLRGISLCLLSSPDQRAQVAQGDGGRVIDLAQARTFGPGPPNEVYELI